MHLKNKRIILSKINQIGDVIFALPLASAIKQLEPSAHIIFLGTQYTQELIEHYPDVDEFADWGAIYQDENEIAAAKNLQKLQADVIVHVMANKPAHLVCKVAKLAKIPIRIERVIVSILGLLVIVGSILVEAKENCMKRNTI